MRKGALSFLLSENIIKFFRRKKGRFENRPPGIFTISNSNSVLPHQPWLAQGFCSLLLSCASKKYIDIVVLQKLSFSRTDYSRAEAIPPKGFLLPRFMIFWWRFIIFFCSGGLSYFRSGAIIIVRGAGARRRSRPSPTAAGQLVDGRADVSVPGAALGGERPPRARSSSSDFDHLFHTSSSYSPRGFAGPARASNPASIEARFL